MLADVGCISMSPSRDIHCGSALAQTCLAQPGVIQNISFHAILFHSIQCCCRVWTLLRLKERFVTIAVDLDQREQGTPAPGQVRLRLMWHLLYLRYYPRPSTAQGSTHEAVHSSACCSLMSRVTCTLMPGPVRCLHYRRVAGMAAMASVV